MEVVVITMELPKRKHNRLQHYDYSQNGAYFVTICTKHKQNLFWSVGATIGRQKTPPLSQCGNYVDGGIKNISRFYSSVFVEKYTIMPNHLHMIILLQSDCYCGKSGRPVVAPTVSQVIQQFKGAVTKQIGYSVWQRSYHDRIIRGENEYQKIWEYIHTNPHKWQQDCFYNPLPA